MVAASKMKIDLKAGKTCSVGNTESEHNLKAALK